jgi:hypothetical protein
MRGTRAKQIRRLARRITGRTKTTISQPPEPFRYLTGYRRTYRALKRAYKALGPKLEL